jgi:ribulose-5-phosphate 4-epimerase/fuculose-1-phosphate aldolase
MAEIMIKELDSSVALLLRGSGLVTVAENIQEATMLSILIEKSAKVQYMASAIGEPRPIVADEMPGKFGNMPTHFFESSWGHYVSKSKQALQRGPA